MTNFPNSPKLLKGAIIGMDANNPLASVVVFQYNPETLSRTVKAKVFEGEGVQKEPFRLAGAPAEEIKVDIEINAADGLEKGDPVSTTMGVYPQLSALEMLLYPKSKEVLGNSGLLATGTMQIIPPVGPFTLFAWGEKRILPVKITELSITEEFFDPNLNPIKAKISLSMNVLSYNDLPVDHPGYGLFIAHQVMKETMAVIGSAKGAASAVGGAF